MGVAFVRDIYIYPHFIRHEIDETDETAEPTLVYHLNVPLAALSFPYARRGIDRDIVNRLANSFRKGIDRSNHTIPAEKKDVIDVENNIKCLHGQHRVAAARLLDT